MGRTVVTESLPGLVFFRTGDRDLAGIFIIRTELEIGAVRELIVTGAEKLHGTVNKCILFKVKIIK